MPCKLCECKSCKEHYYDKYATLKPEFLARYSWGNVTPDISAGSWVIVSQLARQYEREGKDYNKLRRKIAKWLRESGEYPIKRVGGGLFFLIPQWPIK